MKDIFYGCSYLASRSVLLLGTQSDGRPKTKEDMRAQISNFWSACTIFCIKINNCMNKMYQQFLYIQD
jgi:hypothetical protein